MAGKTDPTAVDGKFEANIQRLKDAGIEKVCGNRFPGGHAMPPVGDEVFSAMVSGQVFA